MRVSLLLILFALGSASVADVKQWQNSDLSALQSEAEMKQIFAAKQLSANAAVTDNQQQYDAVHYFLDLFPDVTQKILFGDVSMTARALDGKLETAELNFRDNMQVDSVFFNGEAANFSHSDDILTINFNTPVFADEFFTVRVVYQGQPQQSGFGAFAFDSYAGKPMIWTLSEPYGARNWWPCKDIPADKADSMDIRVKVRSDLIVASNGSLKSVQEDGTNKIYWWHEQYPMTTYLASMAIYPYYTYSDWYVYSDDDSMEVQFYMFPSSVENARPGNAKTVDIIEAYSKIYGPYPFIEEKYGHAQFLWGGGMEHQTISSMGGFGEGLIAHELAHQWWGDMVTCETFHDIWLNEGFATYSEALWEEYKYGAQGLHSAMSRKTYFGNETVYVENPYVDNIFYYETTYKKASWVLHMLRHVVGDEVFSQILHAYYQEFKFKTINTTQFTDLCERVSGMELDKFFDQWIYKGGTPSYRWLWLQTQTESGWKVSGYLKQEQVSGPIFHMPVDLTITTDSGDQTFVIQNTQQTQEFEFFVAEEPLDVRLDKDKWILARIEEIQQPEFRVQDIAVMDESGGLKELFALGESGQVAFWGQNFGVSATDVFVELRSVDGFINIINGSASFNAVATGGSLDNKESPFKFNVSETAPSCLAQLELVFKSAQGPDQIHSFKIPIGAPTLLIVDDDDGNDYEKYYHIMTEQKNIFADFWSITEQGTVVPELLAAYPDVVWFTGDAEDSTLTHSDQQAVQNYLSGGGRLLLTGQNIGFDLGENGDTTDSLFYANVLFAEFSDDSIEDEAVVGVPGDPVGAALALRFNDVYFGAHNQYSTDVFSPRDEAVAALMYLPSSNTAGLRWNDAETGAHLVYLGFGLEGVAGPKVSSAADALETILNWFKQRTWIEKVNGGAVPNGFVVQQNYPNPFNPTTTVRYFVPENGLIEAAVYNVRGQRIKSFAAADVASGGHSLIWNGENDLGLNVASGVYFMSIQYNCQNNLETNTVKMLKIE